MVINQDEPDMTTSLGRLAAHVSIELIHAVAMDAPSKESHIPSSTFMDSALPRSHPKPIDRVIFDDGTIAPVEDFAEIPGGTRRVEYHDGIAHLQDTDGAVASELPGTYITIQIPEKTNLVCDLESGTITVKDKVEGDVTLRTAQGDILVKKLRGNTIDLQTFAPDSVIYASSLLEAQTITIRTKGRVRAKQLHGSNIDVLCDVRRGMSDGTVAEHAVRVMDEEDDEGSLVDISSLFASGKGGATITLQGDGSGSGLLAQRAVRVKSHHGPVKVTINGLARPTNLNPLTERVYPTVELGGVNGSCEVSIANTSSSTDDVDADWSSCLVHVDSLSLESVSLVTADHGNIAITLDRKVESDLRLASLSDAACLVEAGALLAEEEDQALLADVLRHLPASRDGTPHEKKEDSVSIQTAAFTLRPSASFQSKHAVYMDGWVENKSDEPDSRYERKVRGDGGKIRHEGAAQQALDGFSNGGPTRGGGGDHGGGAASLRPLLAAVGTGRITVETVSWLGAIARRYGLEETGRDLGRTASRRGRPLAQTKE